MICPQCKAVNDATTSVENPEATPGAGDVSLCFSCGYLAVFTGDGDEVREPTPEEAAAFGEDPEVRRVQRAIYVSNVNSAEDRTRFECGCRMATNRGVFFFLPCSSTCDVYAYVVEQGRKTGKTIGLVELR